MLAIFGAEFYVLQFAIQILKIKINRTIILPVVLYGRPARPRPTALLSPRSDGKPEASTAVIVAPDDGHVDARNMLSCI